MDDRVVRSPLLPGGDLIAALLDREVMMLADRGGASNLIGARWADLCAEHARSWVGEERRVPGGDGPPLRVTGVARLDDAPGIAAAAARRGLQNPDLLLIGTRQGVPTIQAADAKFSVETARSKQVSPAVVEGLLGLGEPLNAILGNVVDATAAPSLVPGVFLSPDFPLTHLMLRRRHGIVRTTVRPDEVVLVPAPAGRFFGPLAGASVMPVLAEVDDLPTRIDASLLAGLYYFRLARAAAGCWLDATKPLLLHDDAPRMDEGAVRREAAARAPAAPSAMELIARWNADVQTVRGQRAAVEQVAALPIPNRELRDLIAREAARAGVVPPSVNQVRRRVGSWYRGRLRDAIGPLYPPLVDLPRVLNEIARVSASLAPGVQAEAVRVVAALADSGRVVETGADDPVAEAASSLAR